MSFRQDVERTKGLKGHYHPGVQALKSVDRGRIAVAQPIGSLDVDSALKAAFPNDARWDYLIGQKCNAAARLHWVEVHPSNGDHTIVEVTNKLRWLKGWLIGTRLKNYDREFHWVSSGKCSFNAQYPRLRSLAQQGLHFSGQYLSIGRRS